ncbi:glycosyltransferase family 4 protein [Spongiactinospora sp. TRM90649]|uniref:glycosyltransferase family 4 protein n=1 Tax=Spongiactinospora sp. TRM90649 TaxID=3031114 RepID=UPI0023F7FF8C|nr:glycosyltransferase family 4 protein [Spongiactinospora sp. TRM90649]MDF5759222.1 glycosyltransferase family 4 protein [Spongiactinospora sp. TRM90649]
MDEARILLVLGTSAGGVGRHVRMLAAGLVCAGHRVVVAGPAETGERFGFAAAGARFLPVPISDRPHPAGDLRAMTAIRRAGGDVVHAHGLRAGALAALAVTGTRVPVAVTLHNALTAGGAVGAVYGVLERIVARRASVVLPVSGDLGERMAALGARRVTPAVVPAPALRPAERTPQETRAALGVPGDRPILLTVARLAQQKGLETLLDVAASVPEAEFVVAGDGPLREPLEAGVRERGLPVRLLGDRHDIPDLLAAADAVLLPSRWEGQPLSLQEALLAGRPVIATAVGGVPEMVRDAGLLVAYGDVAAMTDAVRRVLGDPALAVRLAEASARRGGELPGEDDAVRSVLALYRTQLGSATGHQR